MPNMVNITLEDDSEITKDFKIQHIAAFYAGIKKNNKTGKEIPSLPTIPWVIELSFKEASNSKQGIKRIEILTSHV